MSSCYRQRVLLREVVLEGFKSYGRRTVVGPLDGRFTCIVGCNGAGKSVSRPGQLYLYFIGGVANLSAETMP